MTFTAGLRLARLRGRLYASPRHPSALKVKEGSVTPPISSLRHTPHPAPSHCRINYSNSLLTLYCWYGTHSSLTRMSVRLCDRLVLSPHGFVGGLVAGLGGLLRIVGYMHWATDVLTGAAFGTLCGYGLPVLLFDTSKRARTADGGQDVEGNSFSMHDTP
eukprot:COSAG06_NODE_10384_length_1690_cov_3.989315_2_plen_160_part_00